MIQKQICLRRICSSIGVGRMHTTHTQEAYHVSHPSDLKLAISLQRMKAETLSWPRGFPSVLHGFVHLAKAKVIQMRDMTKEKAENVLR